MNRTHMDRLPTHVEVVRVGSYSARDQALSLRPIAGQGESADFTPPPGRITSPEASIQCDDRSPNLQGGPPVGAALPVFFVPRHSSRGRYSMASITAPINSSTAAHRSSRAAPSTKSAGLGAPSHSARALSSWDNASPH